MPIYFATSSARKVQEAAAILGLPLTQINLDLPEIQALAVEEVVVAKARAAFAATGKTVLVDDTGFALEAWQGLPGALVRWFLETVGVAGICQMLAGAASRVVTVTTVVAVCDGEQVLLGRGALRGVVPAVPRGDLGFGWDTIFQPDGSDKTFAEMTDAEKNGLSMRRLALEELRPQLVALAGGGEEG